MEKQQDIMKISDLVPDAGNYNKGTENGRKLIGKSLKKFGAGRSILIDKDGNVIAGNKTLEGAAAAGIDEVIVVKTTGRQIVAVQRTDLEINTKKGREMALADNATGAANLSWDLEMMAADGWTDKDLEGWGVDLAGAVVDDYPQGFSLPDGDKPPFEQITLTFSTAQAETVKKCIKLAKDAPGFNSVDADGNNHPAGNAAHFIFKQWLQSNEHINI